MELNKEVFILALGDGAKGKTVANTALFDLESFFAPGKVVLPKYAYPTFYIITLNTGEPPKLLKRMTVEEVQEHFGPYLETEMFKYLARPDKWTTLLSAKVIRHFTGTGLPE